MTVLITLNKNHVSNVKFINVISKVVIGIVFVSIAITTLFIIIILITLNTVDIN
jgi:hypothetical protein